MEVVYLISFPVNQVSVPVGEVPAMIAKAMHPKDWDFWMGREALFNQLVAKVWHRVSREFPGQVAAAKEVRSILEDRDDESLPALLPKLSGNNFYQLYLAGVHKRLLFKAVDDGDVTLVDSSPFRAYPVKKNDFDMLEFRPADRVKLADLRKYLRPYGVGVDESIPVATGDDNDPDKKPRVPFDEKRGKIILRALNTMGLDPENLPAYTTGQSTVKARVKEQIREVALSEFAPDGDLKKLNKAFDRAWSWLAKNDRINHPKAES